MSDFAKWWPQPPHLDERPSICERWPALLAMRVGATPLGAAISSEHGLDAAEVSQWLQANRLHELLPGRSHFSGTACSHQRALAAAAHQRLQKLRAEFVRLSDATPLHAMKGARLQHAYGRFVRPIGDVDAWARDWADLWRAIPALVNDFGYSLHSPLFVLARGGQLSGQVTFVRYDEGERLLLDIHFGHYVLDTHSSLSINGPDDFEGLAVLPLVGRAYADGILRLRDVLDLGALLEQGISTEAVASRARAAGLGTLWRVLFANADALRRGIVPRGRWPIRGHTRFAAWRGRDLLARGDFGAALSVLASWSQVLRLELVWRGHEWAWSGATSLRDERNFLLTFYSPLTQIIDDAPSRGAPTAFRPGRIALLDTPIGVFVGSRTAAYTERQVRSLARALARAGVLPADSANAS